MLRTQPDFLEELAVHGFFRRFAALDAALRELPGMLTDALAPENLVLRVTKNDADVRAIAFTVEHRNPAKIIGCPNSFTKAGRMQSRAGV